MTVICRTPTTCSHVSGEAPTAVIWEAGGNEVTVTVVFPVRSAVTVQVVWPTMRTMPWALSGASFLLA